MRKVAISLIALLATLALFATVSALAEEASRSDAPIIDPAIDKARSASDAAAPALVQEGSTAPAP